MILTCDSHRIHIVHADLMHLNALDMFTSCVPRGANTSRISATSSMGSFVGKDTTTFRGRAPSSTSLKPRISSCLFSSHEISLKIHITS